MNVKLTMVIMCQVISVLISKTLVANESEYVYKRVTYSSLIEAVLAMEAAHQNDEYSPDVESLSEYSLSIDPYSNKIFHKFKIDRPIFTEALEDTKIWTYPYPTSSSVFSSEGSAIQAFLEYHSQLPSPDRHCSMPTFNGFAEEFRLIYVGPVVIGGDQTYDAGLPWWRVFNERVYQDGLYTQHGWESSKGGITYCNAPGGHPQDYERRHGGPTEITIYTCPEGYMHGYQHYGKECELVQVEDSIEERPKTALVIPDVCIADAPSTEGNPCSAATGRKSQTETDYIQVNGSLKVIRYYSSQGVGDGYDSLGPRWRHNYTAMLNGYGVPDFNTNQDYISSFYSNAGAACREGWDELKGQLYGGLLSDGYGSYSSGTCSIYHQGNVVMVLPLRNTHDSSPQISLQPSLRTFYRSNGDSITFRLSGGIWQSLKPGLSHLTETDEGWLLTTSNGAEEAYDVNNRLVSSRDSTGKVTNYAYDDAGRLIQVTGPFGDNLTYTYNEYSQLINITTPDGELGYGYDSSGRLVNVTYPDNRTRQYHYEDTLFPNHLTGITDENGDRYATWAYDAEGRAILSEHAGNAERVEFAYNPDGTTTVTDAAGAERIYHFTVQQGQMKVDHIEGDRCTTCSGGGIQAYTYDDNGFVASKTDWNGNTITYTRDDQGRELSRTEASGTPQARTITTTWDTSLNKPLTVTEPEQRIEYTYDTEGRLLSRQQSPIQ